jgi:glycosyltransferase involved in cell wall biosynthesis
MPFTLLFAGDGVERMMMEDLVHSLGLDKQVRFLGFQRDIPAFLAGIDIFVAPTLSEGLSMSLMEAMAAARPIVTTSILANAELIENKVTGLLVHTQSPEEIAHAVATFVRKPEFAEYCSKNARKRVLDYYTLDRMFQETWDLYLELMSNKRLKTASIYELQNSRKRI